jgi:hypothetical protein
MTPLHLAVEARTISKQLKVPSEINPGFEPPKKLPTFSRLLTSTGQRQQEKMQRAQLRLKDN